MTERPSAIEESDRPTRGPIGRASSVCASTPRRLTRRPSSAFGAPLPSKKSIVQQKLQTAIQSDERVAADLIRAQAHQSSFRARGAAAAERDEADRSVSRYRNDAAIISFADPPSASTAAASTGFCYSNNFMPGVHFYTFLATRDTSLAASSSSGVLRPPASPGRMPVVDPVDTEGENHSHSGPSRKTAGLRMLIPDTVVYGETGRAVLLYTDEDGIVQRSTEVSDKMVLERLAVSTGNDFDSIVVCKEPTTMPAKRAESNALAYRGNLLRLLAPGELKTVLSNVSSTRSTKSFALQRFVRCKGSKAFIVRAVHEAGKPPYAWMINNSTPIAAPAPTVSQVLLSLGQDANYGSPSSGPTTGRSESILITAASSSTVIASDPGVTGESANEQTPGGTAAANAAIPLVNRVCTSVQVDKTCTFIKLSERGCTQVAELNKRLVKFIEHRLRLRLQTLVADFTKDADGRWWLLQVKHFRVRPVTSPSKSFYSLPRRFRVQYLGYRDSSVVEETAESDEEHDRERHAAEVAAQMTQRQVQKLTQCKCCLAAYPKGELSFKMTLKMINEMLVRIRSRLPPEKTYTFLTAALGRESTDPSLAYESWSVCSHCYAIYERDQQLQKVEKTFAEILGAPDQSVLLAGLGKLDDGAVLIDPSATSTVLPAQLTLCRLMLVINGIYDIPPELYDAEKSVQVGTASNLTSHGLLETVSSRLYLRISAFGYTECIPVDPSEICISHEKAPRGTRRRRSSAARTVDGNDSDEGDDSGDDSPRRPEDCGSRNYWLPIHLIRTIHFFAPRTPLHAKLKETSGLSPFLNEDNSISIQLVRATEPPLLDPMLKTTGLAERGRNRRTALQPQSLVSNSAAAKSESPKKHHVPAVVNHSILLGATKLRMAQFRSAYVTKLDFYACMALTGEMFNIKGNLGLERVRYVDTKLLTSRYRLRTYNGVYIPDASYVPSDPLTSEWMDCLRASAIVSPVARAGDSSLDGSGLRARQERRHSTRLPTTISHERMRQSTSTTSLSAGNEDMDEELEDMIEHASQERQNNLPATPVDKKSERVSSISQDKTMPSRDTQMTFVQQQLLPSSVPSSRIDSQMSMLMQKPVVSPRIKPEALHRVEVNTASSQSATPKSVMWSLVIQLNHVHNLQSREHPYCRWECYYELFGQRRSAVERSRSAHPVSPQHNHPDSPSHHQADEVPFTPTEVSFSCTHRFYLSATASMLASHLRSNPSLVLSLRNDVYSSTRSQPKGEFFCRLDVSGLMGAKAFDSTLDVHTASNGPELTPREAAHVSRFPPYLSVSVQLMQLTMDPNDVVSTGEFVVVGATNDGIHVLKKIT